MTVGSLFYRFREILNYGFLAVYYRDFVRERILDTECIHDIGKNSVCDIHVITSAGDWLNLMWTLKSFYRFSGREYGLCIHDDGSLTDEIIKQFQRHFPGGRLIRKAEADEKIIPLLEKYPSCQKLRSENFICMKEFDFKVYANADRLLCLDSDVLFFDEPLELLRRIEDSGYSLSCFNRDLKTAYSCSPEEISAAYGFNMIEQFNSGVGMIPANALDWELMEHAFEKINILGHPWRFEQTLMAICAARYGAELLPKEYDVSVSRPCVAGAMKHYVGEIRFDMYREGMRHLVKSGFLNKKDHSHLPVRNNQKQTSK
jgi:hypothetical protein